MEDINSKILLLEQGLKIYKEVTDKKIIELTDKVSENEREINKLKQSKEKTDYQYEEIMKALNKLNDTTIPGLVVQIEELKNKPAKRYDQVITAFVAALVSGIVGVIIGKFTK